MARKTVASAVALLFISLGCLGLAPAAGAATTEQLVLSQSAAFSLIGHSCGGIQEQVYATGFAANGYPAGDVYMQTRCGGSGRGGGYKTTTYSAWATVTWDWFANTRSYARLEGADLSDHRHQHRRGRHEPAQQPDRSLQPRHSATAINEATYVAHLKTSEQVSCSTLTSLSAQPTTTPVSLAIKWAPKEAGSSKGTLIMPLTEWFGASLGGTLEGGPFEQRLSIFASSVYESFTGGPTCGVPPAKKTKAAPVKSGTFTSTQVEIGG